MKFIFNGGECDDPISGNLKKDFENLLLAVENLFHDIWFNLVMNCMVKHYLWINKYT